MITLGPFCTFHLNFNEFSAASGPRMKLICAANGSGKFIALCVWTKSLMIDAFRDAGQKSNTKFRNSLRTFSSHLHCTHRKYSSKPKSNLPFVVGCR